MTEYPQHKRAKARVAELFKSLGNFQNVEVEHDTGVCVPTYRGPKPYIADVYAELVNDMDVSLITKVVIEVDGKKGHSGRIAHAKNNHRDALLKEKGFLTVRFPTKWLVGKKAIRDDDILDQINWALRQ